MEFTVHPWILSALIGSALLGGVLLLRIWLCIPSQRKRTPLTSGQLGANNNTNSNSNSTSSDNKSEPITVPSINRTISTLVVFGSGGHTGEMIKLISKFDLKEYTPLHFVIAHSDHTSPAKILSANPAYATASTFSTIHRSREVKQSLLSSVASTLQACLDALRLVHRHRPQLILCNGPGTCVPICFVAFLFKVTGIYAPKIIFIESFCRVKSLSMTGYLLYYIADRFIVHWPQQALKYRRSEYLGQLL